MKGSTITSLSELEAELSQVCPQKGRHLLSLERPGLNRIWHNCPTDYRERLRELLLPALTAEHPNDAATLWRRTLQLCERTVRPPFAKRTMAAPAWPAVCALPFPAFHRVLGLPDAFFLSMDAVCVNQGSGAVLGRGLQLLLAHHADPWIDQLQETPRPVLKAALALGYNPRRKDVLAKWYDHPLVTMEANLSSEAMIAQVDAHLPERVNQPVPKKLRRLLRGETELKPSQEQRLHQLLAQNLQELRLQLLEVFAATH